MISPTVDNATLSPLKQAYLALERLQARLDAVEDARREPIAIVGIGCRLPGGADGPDAFWRLLRDGVDAVAEVPPDRWDIDALYDADPDAPGKMASRWGAWLDGVDHFDARLFGIAPREAAGMDPQQRLVLEVAWHALENAGQAPDRLSGSRTGVFAGIVTSDYAQLQAGGGAARHIDPYFGSGNAHSMASGRLSYVLGLQGPSLSIDTACSSSLVAVHLAVQSLRRGECDMALAGGVNVMLAPETTIALSKLRMLAPDGRCKAFDARADGFVRGEGAAMIVLKRLSDAVAQHDPIVALVRGTAVNQDGPSSGLTVPNGPAQAAVIRAAVRDGGVAPADVTFVEAHGTGTALGDPLEIQALAEALGTDRPADRPIHVGSVKTNLGHLEAAAGITGLIKAALSLAHGAMPPHLHLASRNPHVPWDRLPVVIPTTPTPWPAGAPRVAGVSAFGFSGTNAHVVLAAAPPAEAAPAARRPRHILCLSAATGTALAPLAERYADHLAAAPPASLADVCFTANTGRASLGRRAAIVAASEDDAAAALRSVAAGTTPADGWRGEVAGDDPPRIAFLFTGQGAQRAGMARQLFETEPTFRAAIERCDAWLRRDLDRPLVDVLYPDPRRDAAGGAAIDDTTYTQPALFALAYGLVELLRACGIVPDAVLGHSLGELAAACAAGAIGAEDGLRLAAARGRLMGGLPRDGAMAAVRAGEARVRAAIAPYAADVALAAVNGPADCVISGRAGAVDAACRDLEREAIAVWRLNVSHAFHSPLMDPILDELERAAGMPAWKAPATTFVGLVTGAPAGAGEIGSGAYWRQQARAPVRFADGIAALAGRRIDAFVEIGPHPVLTALGRRCRPSGAELWLPCLRRDHDDWRSVLAALGALWVRGAPVAWAGLDTDPPRRRVALPTYPFQRTRHWFSRPDRPADVPADGRSAAGRNGTPAAESGGPPRDGRGGDAARAPTGHPLLGARLASPLDACQFEARLDAARLAYIADHRVGGRSILPAAAFVELIHAAAEHAGPGPRWSIEDLVIHAPLAFADPDADRPLEAPVQRVQTVVLGGHATDAAELSLRVFALPAAAAPGDAWTLHATARATTLPDDRMAAPDGSAPVDVDAIGKRCRETVSAEEHRVGLRARGLDFGPSLHGVVEVRRREGESLGRVRLPDDLAREAGAYGIHPALLDACLQVVAAALPHRADDTVPYFPLAIDRFHLLRPPAGEVLCHVTLRAPASAAANGTGDGAAIGVDPADSANRADPPPATLTADVDILDADGRPIAAISGLQLVRGSRELRAAAMPADVADWLYTLDWMPSPARASGPVGGAGLPPVDPIIDLATRLAPRLSTLAAEHRLADHRALVDQLGDLVSAYIRQALSRLGWRPLPPDPATAGPRVEPHGIEPRYQRLLARLLAILVEDGDPVAAREPAHRVDTLATGEPPAGSADRSGVVTPNGKTDAALAALRAAYPASTPLIDLTARCGAKLADVLAGTEDPLALLFPGGSIEEAARLYSDTPEARVFQTLAAEAVARAVDRWPSDAPVRILEIGAGTGGTTGFVLDRLAARRVHYTFTDISTHLLGQARTTFRAFPFVDYRVLDIERDPAAQGFPAAGYDIVLAANVLHATADLRQAVDHARSLLAPGGLLVLLEATAPERWIDITFGLTDGWWRFTDHDRRTAGPLIDAAAWEALLVASGFGAVSALVEPSGASHQALVLARAPRVDADLRGTWLILADAGGVGRRLADRLAALGGTPRLVEAGEALAVGDAAPWRANPARPADLAAVVRAAERGARELRGVLYLWGLDMPAPSDDAPATLEPAMRAGVGGALHLVQALVGADRERAPRLWLATRGAWPAGAVDRSEGGRAPMGFVQAPLWGLGRAAGLEHPELAGARVDLDPAADVDRQAEALLSEILGGDGESDVAYRGGARHVLRLVRSPRRPAPAVDIATALDTGFATAPIRETTSPRPATETPPVRLVTDGGGVLEGIRWVAAERRNPGPGEAEIRVHATGINFRDVLNALAMRRDDDPLGTECAGLVTAVGAGVDALRPGDAVVAIAPGCFGTYATTRADLVAPLPPGLDFAAGATLPMAFLTAELALLDAAGLGPGETVLIHAAAGGVGQAAVQVARRAGAEVFATAGSAAKRAYLTSIGIRHVFDSRRPDFADEVLRHTGGRGVDVVLNQLAGDFIPAGLRALAGDGRFVEIGKRDIWDAVQAAAVKPHAGYHVVDLAAAIAADPGRIGAMFHDLVARVHAGAVAPLPRHVFPFAAAPDAFRLMARAGHIGKIVLVDGDDAAADADGARPAASTRPPAATVPEDRSLPRDGRAVPVDACFRPDATYLITGGLAGLGLAVAAWMAGRGARHLVLVGRRPPGAAERERIAAIEAGGTRVVVATGDVADAPRLAEILAAIDADLPPLRGVIHAAGVLDDGVIGRLDWNRFAAVLAPKVDGAWNLHVLTRRCDLDAFVLFSSASSVFGSAGQANHAAANAFLDGLAHHRRACGRPAVSINWGAWSQIGAAAARGVDERVAAHGMGAIAPSRGLEALAEVLRRDPAQILVSPVDWARHRDSRGDGTLPPWLAEMAHEPGARPSAPSRPDRGGDGGEPATATGALAAPLATPLAAAELRARLADAPPVLAHGMLVAFVAGHASRVLSLPADEAIDPRRPLHDLGLDSLMAVELRNRLAVGLALAQPLPATVVLDHPTLDALAARLARELPMARAPVSPAPGRAAPADAAASSAGDLVAAIAALSDDEVDRMLGNGRGS